ncbi:MAG TPA: hypothetical protein VG796_21715 [Verrucomicrobiales bacterium]|nr:hypothetical protein [Verrucomicrobiales bacterium]
MVPRRPYLLTVATVCGLAACVALAVDSPSADPLVRLRTEWRTQVEKETKTLRERYAQNLQKLEKELAAKGDYSGAAKARQERRKVLPGPPAQEAKGPAEPGVVAEGQPILLEAAKAIITGGVTYNSAMGALTGWNAAGAVVSWLLPPGMKAGGYEVELTWSCPQENAGTEFQLKEDRYNLRRILKPTSSWDLYQTEVIGTLRLIANSRVLEFSTVAVNEAAAAVRDSDVLHLKSVRLLPAAATK